MVVGEVVHLWDGSYAAQTIDQTQHERKSSLRNNNTTLPTPAKRKPDMPSAI
jgi:hypothetical protein